MASLETPDARSSLTSASCVNGTMRWLPIADGLKRRRLTQRRWQRHEFIAHAAVVERRRGILAQEPADAEPGERGQHGIDAAVENRALSECRRVLTPSGTLVLNSGSGKPGLRFVVRLLRPLVMAPFARQRLRRYLQETAAALRYLEAGHARGKVAVDMSYHAIFCVD